MALRRQSVELAFGMILAQSVTAFTYVVAARSATPEAFGQVVSVTALGQAIGGFADWGGVNHALRTYATGAMSPGRFSAWMKGRASWYLVLAAGFAGSTVLAGVSEVVAIGAAALMWASAMAGPATIPWRVARQFLRVATASVASKTAGLVTIFAVQKLAVSAYLALPSALALAWSLEFVIARTGWPARAKTATGVEPWPWKGTLRLGASSSLISLQSLDLPILGLVSGAAPAGTFGAVSRWTVPMGLAGAAVAQAASPGMAQAPTSRAALSQLRAGLPFLGLGALGVTVVLVFADNLVLLVLGNQYSGAEEVLRILAVGVMITLVNQPIYALLVSRRKDRTALTAISVGISGQLLAVALFSWQAGAVGAAWGIVVGQLLIFAALTIGTVLILRQEPRGDDAQEQERAGLTPRTDA